MLKQILQEDLAAECEVDYSQINRMELARLISASHPLPDSRSIEC